MKKKHILLKISNRIGKANKKRNTLLAAAIALSIAALFVLLSLAKGRIQADSLKLIREKGTAATAFLDSASEEQYETLAGLSYIDEIGIKNEFGIWYENEKRLSVCSFADEQSFVTMYEPAYDNIVGSYPKRADEVMLSQKTLDTLGIPAPEIGIDIPMDIVRNDWMQTGAENIMQTFHLSGYYTDYISDANCLPTAYFSEAFLLEQSIERFPATVAMKSDSLWITGRRMEELLYQEVSVEEEQQIHATDAGILQALQKMTGGIIVALMGILLILVSIYLFIANIMSISIGRDRKQYGLLRIIGTTPKQIRRILLIQSIKIIGIGVIFGILLGSFGVTFAVQKLIEEMYLAGMGSAKRINLYSEPLLLLSAGIVGLGAWVAIWHSSRFIMKLSPMACLIENESYNGNKKTIASQRGSTLSRMAWRNVTRMKKKMVFSIAALFLGFEVCLLFVMLAVGLDETNEIAQNPDFEIGITKEAVEFYIYSNDGNALDETQGHELLTEEFISDIVKTAGIEKSDIVKVSGVFGTFDYSSGAITPRLHAYHETTDITTELTVQVVSDEWMSELKRYVEKNNISIDMDTLQHKNGFVLLHSNEVSERQVEIGNVIGETLPCFFIEDGGRSADFTCCGYLDITEKGFPPLIMPWNGKNLNYIVVSENTFQSTGAKKLTYNITFDTDEEQEFRIKNALSVLLAEANQGEEVKSYYMAANSDVLKEAKSYILATRIVMGTFAGILIVFALINYCNTVITGMIARRRVFAVMQSIGMTRRQLRGMIIMEGLIYYSFTLLLLISLGSFILIYAGRIMKSQVPYFSFQYPTGTFILIAGLLLFICVAIPLTAYKREQKETPVDLCRATDVFE